MKSIIPWIGLALWGLVGCQPKQEKKIEVQEISLGDVEAFAGPELLSDWGFFQGDQNQLKPEKNVFPYAVNAPLFSDYAEKARFIFLPADSSMSYHANDLFEFPLGAVLVKNFYYPNDFRQADGKRRILETRLIAKEEDGWRPYSYIWNESQTDATLEVVGRSIPISWTDRAGELKRINYSVPNINQCKSCHERNGRFHPIGVTARQLNTEYEADENQLVVWQSQQKLTELPDLSTIPKLVSWSHLDLPLERRARSWLETNCAHCHRRDGPAKNSGLYLLAQEEDLYALGIYKPPVAAGRGSGGMKYAIFPGKPQESILIHRIRSLDPGVMMPELGRKLVHTEGLALIEDWIAKMPAN